MSSMTLVLALAVPVTMAGLAPPPQRAPAKPRPPVAAPPVEPGVPGAAALPQQNVNEELAALALARARQRLEQERAAFAAASGAPRGQSRTTVCGTQLHEVDPSIDPKIIVPPAERAPEPKVRRITPTLCHEPR
jgi:hypothetical protein